MMMRTSPVSRVACSSRTVQQNTRPMVAVQAAKDAPKWQPIAMSVLASLMLSSAPVSAANTQSLANPSGDAPTSTALGNKYNVSNPTAPAGLTGENQSYPPESAKESVFGERGFIGAVEDKISGVTNSISNVGDKISNAASDAGSAGDDVKSSIKSVVSDVQNSTPSAGGAKASVSNALEDAKSSVSNTLNKAKNGISMAAPGANNPVEKAAAGAAKVQEVVSDNVKIARDDSNSAKNAKITVDQANRKVDQLFTGR